MAKAKKRKVAPGDVASNRYASYRFELLERLECGIALEGTEVKALRNGGAQLKDRYAPVRDGELWLHNVHIPPYGPAARSTSWTRWPNRRRCERSCATSRGSSRSRASTSSSRCRRPPAAGPSRDR